MSSLEDNISTIPCGTPTGTSCGTPTGTSCGTPTGTPGGTPSKRIKRFCKYRTEWQADHVWVSPVLGNIYKANCTMCHRVFSISHGGRSDLRQHAAGNYHIRTMQELSKQGVGIDHFMLPHNFSSEEADMGVEDLKSSVDLSMGGNYHVRAMQGQKMPGGMDQFMIPQTYTEADMVTAAELTQVYHTVKHNLSYNSTDCAQKLTQKILPDSKVAKKISCGRTKAQSLVKDLLAPKAVRDVVEMLEKYYTPHPFSIQTDVCHKGNRNMRPVAIQFFTPECGVVNKMIDFIENPDESAEGIVGCLLNSLEGLGLQMDQVSAFGAADANADIGVHDSVYIMLRRQQLNLLQGNCHAHLVHDTLKHALDHLSVDVENVVLKIYSFFSISAKRREALKEFCDFCDIESKEALRHVTTRWLSLNPAISRLLQSWSALKCYFLSLGDECPKQIRTLLKLELSSDSGVQKNEEEEAEDDVVEVYLLFCSNILSLFEEVVKKLEAGDTTSVELYPIMHSFRAKLIQRRDDQFYGYVTRTKFQRLSPVDAGRAREEFTAFIDTALGYIEEGFNFSASNWLHCLSPVSLHGKLTFNNMEEISERLQLIARLNMDGLYDECTAVNIAVEKFQEGDQWHKKGVAAKWMAVFQVAELPNILTIISYILSVPASTGFVQKIFSRMNDKWSEVRNRCSVELMRSELLVSINFAQSCAEFHTVVLDDKALLQAARSNRKYMWKKEKGCRGSPSGEQDAIADGSISTL